MNQLFDTLVATTHEAPSKFSLDLIDAAARQMREITKLGAFEIAQDAATSKIHADIR